MERLARTLLRWVAAALMALLGAASPLPAHAQEVTDLAAGAVHTVTPADTECFSSAFDSRAPNDLLCPIRAFAQCKPDGQAHMSIISCVTLLGAEAGAHAHYQFWFRVTPAGGASPGATPSFVPIHIFAPDVIWDLKLTNGALDEDAGSASALYKLRLRSDPVDNASERGTVTTETSVLIASHGGISGCLSIPTGVDDVANLFISCQLASDQIQQGKASPSLSAVVEVGRVYNLELAMDFNAGKRFTVKPTRLAVSNRLEDGDPPGPLGGENVMKWSKFVVTVGSATDDLQAQIDLLRDRLEQHAHPYLTGPGGEQNKVEVSTGLPTFNDGNASGDADLDGVADIFDACPSTQAGDPVDAAGCSIDDFCATHVVRMLCKEADWRGDEASKPKDCAWQNQRCEALGE
jgi:hypothetical protein